ncbi:MAG: hypothetical protein LBD84_00970, partial [Campylobacteraceae bacterium]|nr:hypothetical protein [Campylobacteraceae bacterium]
FDPNYNTNGQTPLNSILSSSALLVFDAATFKASSGVFGISSVSDVYRGGNTIRLKMQLSAEEVAGVKAPTQITSYSQHATEQIAKRDGGKGVSQIAIDDAWSNPLQIEYVSTQYGATFRYTGADAVIVVNTDGKVVTAWAKSSSGVKSE